MDTHKKEKFMSEVIATETAHKIDNYKQHEHGRARTKQWLA
jgi:hypothetical protein